MEYLPREATNVLSRLAPTVWQIESAFRSLDRALSEGDLRKLLKRLDEFEEHLDEVDSLAQLRVATTARYTEQIVLHLIDPVAGGVKLLTMDIAWVDESLGQFVVEYLRKHMEGWLRPLPREERERVRREVMDRFHDFLQDVTEKARGLQSPCEATMDALGDVSAKASAIASVRREPGLVASLEMLLRTGDDLIARGQALEATLKAHLF